MTAQRFVITVDDVRFENKPIQVTETRERIAQSVIQSLDSRYLTEFNIEHIEPTTMQSMAEPENPNQTEKNLYCVPVMPEYIERSENQYDDPYFAATYEKPPLNPVMQDWTMHLPLRYQGVLLTGIRGGDLTPKQHDTLDSIERRLVSFYRYCVMNPADIREIDAEPGCFFTSKPPIDFRFSSIGHYPLHWVSHIMHCYQIVAYEHPNYAIRGYALDIYLKCVQGLHLRHETQQEIRDRLTEDRIANKNVVQ